MNIKIDYINPKELIKNPAFTNVIRIHEPKSIIYIGGQNAVNSEGKIIGRGDIKAQTEQILKNIDIALTSVGATKENIVKWTIYIISGHPQQKGFEAFQEYWGRTPNPPVLTMVYVSGFAHPDFLAEIDAIAVL